MSLNKPLEAGKLRVLISGSREFRERSLISETFRKIEEYFLGRNPDSKPEDLLLISGACPRGADRIAEEVAKERGWRIELYPADWETYGKAAGHIRNGLMLEQGIDILTAFPTASSRGTWDCVQKAKKLGSLDIVIKERKPSGELKVTNILASKA